MLLKKVDRDLALIHGKIRISRVNPINVEEEKLKVFKDNNRNPKFKYNFLENHQRVEKHLLSLKTDDTVYGVLLRGKIRELNNMLKMIKNVGKKDFTRCSVKVYGKPDSYLLKEAKNILKMDD